MLSHVVRGIDSIIFRAVVIASYIVFNTATFADMSVDIVHHRLITT